MRLLSSGFRLFLVAFFFVLMYPFQTMAQCQLLDGTGTPSANPVWVGCSKVTSANDTDFVIVITPANNFGVYTIDWGDGVIQAGASLNPPAFITHTYISVTGGTNYADTFNVTFTSGACTINGTVISGYPVTANIAVPGGLTQLTCAPGALTFVNNSNGASGLPVMPGTTFTWDWGDGSPVEVFGPDQSGDSIQHTYQRATVNCVTQVTLTATNQCNLSPSVNTQSPVLIYDLDDAAINASATVLCYPDTVVNFSNGSMFNCYAQGNTDQRYEYWNFGNYWGTGSDSIIDWRPSGAPLGTPPPNPVPIAFPGVGTYTVNMIDSNLCGQQPASIVIDIVNPPTAAIAISDDTICAGETVTLQNLSVGGADQFFWNFGQGGGFVSTNGGNRTQTYNNPGSYVITLAIGIAGSTCFDTATINLEVLPSPTAAINLDNQSGCDSLNITFTDASTGAPVSWDWDFDNGQTSTLPNPPTQFYGFPSNFNVTLTVTNALNCSNTDTQVINVYQTPVPAFSPSNVCANQIAQFLDSSTSASGDPIISWNWVFGDGTPNSGLQNPTHIYPVSGNYSIILTVATANCSATDTTVLTAEELPVADFTMDTTSGCSPLAVSFTNASSANAVSYFWDFGDGDTSTQINPSHVFQNNFPVDTPFVVTLIAFTNFGCSDTIRKSVTVFPNPIAQFTDSSLLIKCSPAVIGFTNLSTNGAVSYLWDFGNGGTSTSTNPRDTFVNPNNVLDTSLVTLIAYSNNGCTDTFSREYIIFPKPTGLPAQIDSGCAPLSVTFPATIGAVNYTWDFGDGQSGTGPQPTHLYQNLGSTSVNYNVRLISSSNVGCVDTSFSVVTVHPLPQSQFIANQSIGCEPLQVQFTNLSVGANLFHWDFDDSTLLDTTLVNVSHTFLNKTDANRVFDVLLTAETPFGCTHQFTVQITAYPVLVASFTNDTLGCSPFGPVFVNQSSPSATLFSWDFGDGGSSVNKNPVHGYINNGAGPTTFNIVMIASSTNGCADTATSFVTIYPNPTANFSVNPSNNELTYPDTTFSIQNLSPGWQYIWDFGDGDSSTLSIPGNHAYTGWGQFTIQMISYNEYCSDTSSQLVTILPPLPIVRFGVPAAGCEPLEVTLINTSKYGDSYLWKIFDEVNQFQLNSTDKNPTFFLNQPGNYQVSLQVTGEGGVLDSTTDRNYILVYEMPEADFTFNPEKVFIPTERVVFSNFSKGEGLKFTWDFGDGVKSNAKNPEHFYTAEGLYTITLVAANEHCSDTATSLSPVEAKPTGDVRVPNAFSPSQTEIGNNGGISKSDADKFGVNDAFFPQIIGELQDYEFIVFNKWGEILFRTDERDVGWTGWYRHELCQQDVYVYKVKALKIDNSEVVLVGDITLLR